MRSSIVTGGRSGLTSALPARLPQSLADGAHQSVGAALQVADRLSQTGHTGLAGEVHQVASGAFIHGLSAGCLVAGGVAVAGAIMAAILLPAQPESSSSIRRPAPAQPAGALND